MPVILKLQMKRFGRKKSACCVVLNNCPKSRAFVDVINCIHESPRSLCLNYTINEVYSFLDAFDLHYWFNVLPFKIRDNLFIALGVLCLDIQILESEILQFVLVGLSDVEEYVAAQADIAQRHVVGT